MCTANNKWLPSVMPKDRINPIKGAKEDTIKPLKATASLFTPDKPPPPPEPVKFQAARDADPKPLSRRNRPGGMALTSPTMLSGGVTGTVNAGQVTLLGG